MPPASTNNSLALLGCRFENNSAPGGYEVKLEGGNGYAVVDPSFFATQGAHCLGVGMSSEGGDKVIYNTVVTGGQFQGNGSQVGQKAIVARSNCQGLITTGLRLQHSSFSGSAGTPDSIIDLAGASQTSVQGSGQGISFGVGGFLNFTRPVTAIGVPEANTGRLWIRTVAGKQQLVMRFSDGADHVIAQMA